MHQNSKKYKAELSEDQLCFIEFCCQSEMSILDYKVEVYHPGCNIEDIRPTLEQDEPWDKPSYANIPEDEKQNHALLRNAIEKLLSGSA